MIAVDKFGFSPADGISQLALLAIQVLDTSECRQCQDEVRVDEGMPVLMQTLCSSLQETCRLGTGSSGT